MTPPPSGWYPDPTGRHRTRWWDGAEWRGWVDGDAGVEVDQLPEDFDTLPLPARGLAGVEARRRAAPTGTDVPIAPVTPMFKARWAVVGCAIVFLLVVLLFAAMLASCAQMDLPSNWGNN